MSAQKALAFACSVLLNILRWNASPFLLIISAIVMLRIPSGQPILASFGLGGNVQVSLGVVVWITACEACFDIVRGTGIVVSHTHRCVHRAVHATG